MVISDAAFRKESTTGLSIRGAVIGVGEFSKTTPGGPCHVLEAYSRKQRRVTRSTLVAETHAALDSYETGKVISSALHQLYAVEPEGGFTSVVLARLVQDGPLAMPVEVSSDCRSLFDMIVAGVQGKAPSERTLFYQFTLWITYDRIQALKVCSKLSTGLTRGTV